VQIADLLQLQEFPPRVDAPAATGLDAFERELGNPPPAPAAAGQPPAQFPDEPLQVPAAAPPEEIKPLPLP
jgi:hypothetical protein